MKKTFRWPLIAFLLILVLALAAYIVVLKTGKISNVQEASILRSSGGPVHTLFYVDVSHSDGSCTRFITDDQGNYVSDGHGGYIHYYGTWGGSGTGCVLSASNPGNGLSTGQEPNIVIAAKCPAGYRDGGPVQAGPGIPPGSHICFKNTTPTATPSTGASGK
jgi:hypothetical protein